MYTVTNFTAVFRNRNDFTSFSNRKSWLLHFLNSRSKNCLQNYRIPRQWRNFIHTTFRYSGMYALC